MERKEFTSLMEASTRVLLGETHMIGKTVIVNGKKGKVIEQVGSDGKTESDEIYKVKFEDGTIKDIPARDMEMQGDINNTKEPSENEAEDIVNVESVELALEYFESYFGGSLNESVSDEDIMEAVYDLVELCDAVCEMINWPRKNIDPKKIGTGHVYIPDTIQGKPNPRKKTGSVKKGKRIPARPSYGVNKKTDK